MWTKEEKLLIAAMLGGRDGVARLVDEEGVDVDLKDGVSVCVCFGRSSWCCLG